MELNEWKKNIVGEAIKLIYEGKISSASDVNLYFDHSEIALILEFLIYFFKSEVKIV